MRKFGLTSGMSSSENDKAALCEKILKDFDFIMKRNPNLQSFDIIPLESNSSNTSPVLHQQNNLALEAWCVKYVYMHCYNELMEKYQLNKKKRSSNINSMNGESVRRLLNGALLLNPDVNTFWNVRREMFTKDLLEFDDEMRFSSLVLTRKPKSNETFAYRKWLIEKYLSGNELIESVPRIEEFIYSELGVAEMCAMKCPTNYHAWSHRTWFMKRLQSIPDLHLEIVHIQEYLFSKFWITNNVSDFSGFNYRQHCISNIFQLDNETYVNNFQNTFDFNFHLTKLLLKDSDCKVAASQLLSSTDEERICLMLGKLNCRYITDIAEFLRIINICAFELSLNEDMITFYHSHEALWYHRRFILQTMIRMIRMYFGVRGRKYFGRSPTTADVEMHEDEDGHIYSREMYDSLLFRAIKLNEMEVVQTRKDSDVFAMKYEKWLKFAIGLVC